jgi:dTMP kinase
MDDRGKIIVIEGTDCSGKETQSKRLINRLNEEGYKTVLISFPNYESPTGKIVGGPYLGKPEIGESYFGEEALRLDPKITCLYYAADRKYNMTKVNEYLDNGYYVILDRYVTSNLAHQGGKILDKEERYDIYKWIDKLEYDLLGLPKPDKTIFLRVPYEYAKELKKNRKNLDIHEKSEAHLKNAENSYLELAKLYDWDTVLCIRDGKLRSIEDISDEIYEDIKPILSKNKVKSLKH